MNLDVVVKGNQYCLRRASCNCSTHAWRCSGANKSHHYWHHHHTHMCQVCPGPDCSWSPRFAHHLCVWTLHQKVHHGQVSHHDQIIAPTFGINITKEFHSTVLPRKFLKRHYCSGKQSPPSRWRLKKEWLGKEPCKNRLAIETFIQFKNYTKLALARNMTNIYIGKQRLGKYVYEDIVQRSPHKWGNVYPIVLDIQWYLPSILFDIQWYLSSSDICMLYTAPSITNRATILRGLQNLKY